MHLDNEIGLQVQLHRDFTDVQLQATTVLMYGNTSTCLGDLWIAHRLEFYPAQ